MKNSQKVLSAFLLTASILSAQTLVTVNGTKITQSDVDTALMKATQGRFFNEVPPEKQAGFKIEVLNQLVARELVYGDAKKTGVLKSKEFKTEYNKIVEQIKKDIAVQVWKVKQLEKIKVTDRDVKKYFNDNKGEFREKESVRARHILVKTKEEADKLLKQLNLKGKALKEKFIELAKEKSVGPTGPKGGDLGYFGKGQMVPEFNDKVFSMKVGTVSSPVKTQFGHHIIYLEDKKEAKNLALSDVKEYIRGRLKVEKLNETMPSIMKKLQDKAKIVQ